MAPLIGKAGFAGNNKFSQLLQTQLDPTENVDEFFGFVTAYLFDKDIIRDDFNAPSGNSAGS